MAFRDEPTTPKVLRIKAQGWRSLPWEGCNRGGGTPKVSSQRGVDGTLSAFDTIGVQLSQGTLREPWPVRRNAVGVDGEVDDSGDGAAVGTLRSRQGA